MLLNAVPIRAYLPCALHNMIDPTSAKLKAILQVCLKDPHILFVCVGMSNGPGRVGPCQSTARGWVNGTAHGRGGWARWLGPARPCLARGLPSAAHRDGPPGLAR